MSQYENKNKLGNNSREKIIEVYKKIFYEAVLEEIKPIKDILERRDLTQRFIENLYGEELRGNIEEIKSCPLEIGSELEQELSDKEQKYLAGILYLKIKTIFSKKAYPSITPLVYELLRSAGLISDEDRRRRSEIAKFVFNDLVKKGYIIETELDYDTRHEALPKIRYAYTLNDESPISEIQKFDAYRKLENNQVRIGDDEEFKRTLKRYKKAIGVIAKKINNTTDVTPTAPLFPSNHLLTNR